MIHCPLCHDADNSLYCHADGTDYFQCHTCKLVFIEATKLPSLDHEKSLYDQHENQIDDPHYRKFLSRLFLPMAETLPAAAKGLDYGCGPGPALAAMFNEAGFDCRAFDPIYANQTDLLNQQYDFISCSEVVEHFHHPAKEFDQLHHLLNRNGLLGIMTSWYPSAAEFQRWHYQRDPTHVCFYQQPTFDWVAEHYGYTWHSPDKNIALFKKQ